MRIFGYRLVKVKKDEFVFVEKKEVIERRFANIGILNRLWDDGTYRKLRAETGGSDTFNKFMSHVDFSISLSMYSVTEFIAELLGKVIEERKKGGRR